MTAGKRQPPLWLDKSFAEALERFAGTDLNEAKAGEKEAADARPAAVKPKRSRKRLVEAPHKDADPH